MVADSAENQLQNCGDHVQSEVNRCSCLPGIFTEQLYSYAFQNLLSVSRMSPALIIESLPHQCPKNMEFPFDDCKDVELLDTFRHKLKTELFNIPY